MVKKLVLVALVAAAPLAAWAQGTADGAKQKTSMCIGCHGIPEYKASFPSVYRVPKIAGQSAKYIENALNAYKKGERSHPTMRGIALGMYSRSPSSSGGRNSPPN